MYDERQVQDTVLALMHLDAHEDTYGWRRSKAKSAAWIQTRPRPAPRSGLDVRL